jgi:hypothetical protein
MNNTDQVFPTDDERWESINHAARTGFFIGVIVGVAVGIVASVVATVMVCWLFPMDPLFLHFR